MKKFLFSSALLIAGPLFAQPTDTAKVETPKADVKPKAKKPNAEKKTVATDGKTFLRVIHATIGAPAVDVTADGLTLASGLKFKALSKYTEVKSGSTTIKIMEAGKTTPIAEIKKTFSKGDFYTVSVFGDKTPNLVSILDTSGKDMPDKAKLKVVHLSPGAPEVLITASKKGDPETKFTKFIPTPIAYEKSKMGTKKPGSINLQVRTVDGKIVKDLGEVTFAAGSRTTAFAVGKVGATGETAFDVVIGPVIKP